MIPTGDVVKDTAAVNLRFLIFLVIFRKIIHASAAGDGSSLRLFFLDLDLLLLHPLLCLVNELLSSFARTAIDVALEDTVCLLDTGLDVSLSALGIDDGLESLLSGIDHLAGFLCLLEYLATHLMTALDEGVLEVGDVSEEFIAGHDWSICSGSEGRGLLASQRGSPVADDVLCNSTSLAYSLVSEVGGLLSGQGEARSEGLAIVG